MFGIQNVTAKQAIITSVAAVLALFFVKSTVQNNIARNGHWHGMGKSALHTQYATASEISALTASANLLERAQRATAAAIEGHTHRLDELDRAHTEAAAAHVDVLRQVLALRDAQGRVDTTFAEIARKLSGIEQAQGRTDGMFVSIDRRFTPIEQGLAANTRTAETIVANLAALREEIAKSILPRIARVEVAASDDQDAAAAKGDLTRGLAEARAKKAAQ